MQYLQDQVWAPVSEAVKHTRFVDACGQDIRRQLCRLGHLQDVHLDMKCHAREAVQRSSRRASQLIHSCQESLHSSLNAFEDDT